ncbi:MAG: hypothetical protein ACFE7R_08365, partial [Candidatus Hodarchaeota archaeon]
NDRLSNRLEKYMDYLSSGGREGYISIRGGIWRAKATVVGHSRDPESLAVFESAVRGAVPEREWNVLKSSECWKRILTYNVVKGPPSFYASGGELSKWLVQLPSELAPEVGASVPGEFISPIRGRLGDYPLGRAINPETLQKGPEVGLSHDELELGLLICGGDFSERRVLLANLVSELLNAGKRVLVLSNDSSAIELASLSESGISLELGRDLVLNPVDADGIPRHIYVSKLLSSLQVVAGTDLRGATDLEIALSRAVALGNTTLADVRLDNGDVISDGASGSGKTIDFRPSDESLAGYEAIRSLHQGTSARSFYGSQTISLKDLAMTPLAVVILSQGSIPLTKFAFDLMCIKVAGLAPDPNLVVILEDAENMRIRNRRYMKRDAWSEMMIRDLKKRGPLIVTLDHPVDMAPGAIGRLPSCVTFRLREGPDIKTAVNVLGITVVATGMHSKARQSSRETSYLRIMPERVALLVRNQGETCMPLEIKSSERSLPKPSSEEMSRRISRITANEKEPVPKGETLLDRVAGGSRKLAVKILTLLQRYEPLTEEALRKFVASSGENGDSDVEGVIARLEHASMILRGHEVHSGVSYTNYRITMKGTMALRQHTEVTGGE